MTYYERSNYYSRLYLIACRLMTRATKDNNIPAILIAAAAIEHIQEYWDRKN